MNIEFYGERVWTTAIFENFRKKNGFRFFTKKFLGIENSQFYKRSFSREWPL